jgi:hypothetical protein
VNRLVRPVPGLGAINEFESAASSIYHGLTVSLHRRISSGLYLRHRSHESLRRLFNHWKLTGIVSTGSGRPLNATIAGDANRDLNTANDRLPGVARNSYTARLCQHRPAPFAPPLPTRALETGAAGRELQPVQPGQQARDHQR